MKELVILSGKGGTGKTTLAASFATLAKNAVFADCDVDAADLHLILKPTILSKNEFISGHEAIIRQEDCIGCQACISHCRFDAICISPESDLPRVSPISCEGCGVCHFFCPANAIDFRERNCGEWYISQTRFGPLVHARLGIAAENSGKLVSLVRKEAKRLAQDGNADWIIVDGPPGIGCPVIASISGADAIVIVTEPTLPGMHDLERVIELAKHFNIPTLVCVNKWDINPDLGKIMKKKSVDLGSGFIGVIPYSHSVSEAQIFGKSVVEYNAQPLSAILKELWLKVCQTI